MVLNLIGRYNVRQKFGLLIGRNIISSLILFVRVAISWTYSTIRNKSKSTFIHHYYTTYKRVWWSNEDVMVRFATTRNVKKHTYLVNMKKYY